MLKQPSSFQIIYNLITFCIFVNLYSCFTKKHEVHCNQKGQTVLQ